MGWNWNPFRSWRSGGTTRRHSGVPRGFKEADALLSALVTEGRVPGLSIQVHFRGETWFSAGY
ncbi:MAG: hypothetical protein R3252_07075, partial [Robiginitalea sp.]|nr:hypothetical protein [Robiginitalea sp.]